MRARLATVVTAIAVAVGFLTAPSFTSGAAAVPSRCAAHADVVRETSPGGAFQGRTPVLAASYNIAGYNSAKTMPRWESRADRVVSMIMRCSPDVIGLQEASEAWMQRRPAGSRNYAQYEHVVDLMNAQVQGSPYRVTNTYRKVCPTTGPNPAVWNGTWQGRQAPWRACRTSPRSSSSDNRTVYDSRTLVVERQGSRLLARATATRRTLDWTIFRIRATGQRFVFANTHLEARYRGRAVGSKASNAFRRKQVRQMTALLRQLRSYRGATLPVVAVGDMNTTGRMRMRTPVDDLTRAGLVDVLGTDRRVYRSKRAKWRGSCRSRGVTSSLVATAYSRVPLHLKRRIHAYYNTSNSIAGRKPGTGPNQCMYRPGTKRSRGATARAHYRYQGIRIDYVLASASIRARGWETVVDANLRRARYRSMPPSDHNMVAATLAF
ncbi:endonuclease/exonuclease/phosphatase family protein [Aeromicrobium sp.]|uniref:endonuclease/exonuclease/phosphatase family protein n=1 Tax=Aeromicrobium sp. TaxID=1871063 RepID=UPI0028AD54CC|nr:endonuclease/exonuclease/phosphatase family protein [Aeromicrobium sp.]